MMPKADVIELDMNVDEALKYIISMGVVPPENRSAEAVRARIERSAADRRGVDGT
jgi:uncharacterized membrane protein